MNVAQERSSADSFDTTAESTIAGEKHGQTERKAVG